MYRSIEACRRHNVKLGFGTDLPGYFGERQNEEFRLRAAVHPPLEILRSATSVNAALLISVLAEPAAGISLLISRGSLVNSIQPG